MIMTARACCRSIIVYIALMCHQQRFQIFSRNICEIIIVNYVYNINYLLFILYNVLYSPQPTPIPHPLTKTPNTPYNRPLTWVSFEKTESYPRSRPQVSKEMDNNIHTSEQDVLVFTREKVGAKELGFEQIKFIFKKLSEWLMSRRQEALDEAMEMLEKLRHLYPRAYQILLAKIQAMIAAEFNASPVPIAVALQPVTVTT